MESSNSFVQSLMNEIKENFDNKVIVIDKDLIPQYNYLEVDKWHRVKNVVCVYIDLASSTKINIREHPNTSSRIFKSYVNSFVKIFDEYEAKYIDIQGDGGFALFDGDDAIERAFVSAVTIKSLIDRNDNLSNFIQSKTRNNVKLGIRIALDIGTILVKKLGTRNKINKEYLNNEVWLGKPVSISAKLCNLKNSEMGFTSNTIRLSDRLYDKINNNHILYSCDCSKPFLLWNEVSFQTPFFGLKKAYLLKSNWCNNCGDTFSKNILNKIARNV